MNNKHQSLFDSALFGVLNSEQLNRIANHSKMKKFVTGKPIHLSRADNDSVYLLTKGLVKLSFITAEGKEFMLTFIRPDELIGEIKIFNFYQSEEYYIEAIAPSTLLKIPIDIMLSVIKESSEFSFSLTKLIAERLGRAERRLKNLLYKTGKEKLTHFLLDLADDFGNLNEGEISLDINISHNEIAKAIGSTRETVTVLLGQLRSEGMLRTSRTQIVLTSPTNLANSVQRKI